MRFLKKSAAVVALMFIASVAAAMATPPWALGEPSTNRDHDDQGQHNGPVVSGTVSAVQSGAWNVGIAGTPTVNVANLATNQPVRFGPNFFSVGTVVEAVPAVDAGTEFVLTDAHAWILPWQADRPGEGGTCWLMLYAQGTLMGTMMGIPLKPLLPPGPIAGSQQAFVTIHAGEGVGIECEIWPYDSRATGAATLGGYFKAAP